MEIESSTPKHSRPQNKGQRTGKKIAMPPQLVREQSIWMQMVDFLLDARPIRINTYVGYYEAISMHAEPPPRASERVVEIASRMIVRLRNDLVAERQFNFNFRFINTERVRRKRELHFFNYPKEK